MSIGQVRVAARSARQPGFVREDCGYETPCLVWTGARGGGRDAYGVRDRKGSTTRYVHRQAWEDAFGPIPDELEVCHRCDVGVCAELSHLFLGTHADNMADMDAKGRRRSGERHHFAKLTDAAVREIRASGLARRELAARFGVSTRTIDKVRRREAWRSVA